jgi:hypothetical protein
VREILSDQSAGLSADDLLPHCELIEIQCAFLQNQCSRLTQAPLTVSPSTTATLLSKQHMQKEQHITQLTPKSSP